MTAETASQKIEHLGLMFGALAAAPDGSVVGRGIPLSHLSFAMLGVDVEDALTWAEGTGI